MSRWTAVFVLIQLLAFLAYSAAPSSVNAQEAAGSPSSAAEPTVTGEALNLRTETSRTFEMSDGTYRAEVYTGPIHYRDGSGEWATIDNTLVPSDRPGYAYENAANSYKVFIPEDVAEAPIRIEMGNEWMTYSLDGASGTPAVEDNRVTFHDALDGVDLSYTVLNASLEEDLTLSALLTFRVPILST